MAAGATTLIKLGPFLSQDSTSADIFVSPGDGQVTTNTSCSRLLKGLINDRGRTNMCTYGNTVVGMAPYAVSSSEQLYLACINNGGVYETQYFNPATNIVSTVGTCPEWTEAIQFWNTIYLNNGQQFNIVNPTSLYQWQYQVPITLAQYITVSGTGIGVNFNLGSSIITPQIGDTVTVSLINVTHGTVQTGMGIEILNTAGGGQPFMTGVVSAVASPTSITVTCIYTNTAGGTIPAYSGGAGGFGFCGIVDQGTYYYAITHSVFAPNGAFIQETTPYGADFPYPLSTSVLDIPNEGGALAVPIQGTFSGTNADGSYYTTNIYRQSTNTPVWFLIAQGVTGSAGTIYVDMWEDSWISQFAQLDTNQDPPPITGGSPAFIANYKERAWVFLTLQPPIVGTTTGAIVAGNNVSVGYTVNGNPTIPFFPAQNQEMVIGTDIFQTLVGTNTTTLVGNFKSNHPTNSTVTYNQQPQCQLWFSNYAQPWSFDSVNQVLLVEDGVSPSLPTPPYSYGGAPVGLAVTSSFLILFKTNSTWGVFGDDEFTFQPRKIFDVGCCATNSIANYMGIVYWLSEQGVYMFDGYMPKYISEKVRSTLESIPLSDLRNAVGFFDGKSYCLSFPATGITLKYYTVTGEWRTLNMSTSFAWYNPTNPASYNNTTRFGEVVAARPNSGIVDWWFAGGEYDLGGPITVTWTSPLTDSGGQIYQKTYDYIMVEAPIQTGVTATLTLSVDPGSSAPVTFTTSINLGSGETRHVVPISLDSPGNRGYLARLTVSAQTAGPLQPVTIYSCEVLGSMERNLVIPSYE